MHREYIILLVLSAVFQVMTSQSVNLKSSDVAIHGQRFTLTCLSWMDGMYWFKNDDYIGSSKINSNTCRFSRSRYSSIYEFNNCGSQHTLTIKSINYNTDDGVEWKCRSLFGDYYDTYTIQVKDPPRFIININILSTSNQSTLICTADGQPDDIIFSPWKQYLNDMLIREVKGYMINSTVYGLSVSTDVDSDDGIYICTASNGIINKETGDLHQTTSIQFNTTAKPIFYVDNSDTIMTTTGETANINVAFTSIEKSDIVWYHNSMPVKETERVHILQHDINVTHPYNQNFIIPATKAVITFVSVTPTDRGTYDCRVCNSNGCRVSSFELQVLYTPRRVSQTIGDSPLIMGICGGVSGLLVIIITAVIIFLIFYLRHQQTPKEGVVSESTLARETQDGVYQELADVNNGTSVTGGEGLLSPMLQISAIANDTVGEYGIPITATDEDGVYQELADVNNGTTVTAGEGLLSPMLQITATANDTVGEYEIPITATDEDRVYQELADVNNDNEVPLSVRGYDRLDNRNKSTGNGVGYDNLCAKFGNEGIYENMVEKIVNDKVGKYEIPLTIDD